MGEEEEVIVGEMKEQKCYVRRGKKGRWRCGRGRVKVSVRKERSMTCRKKCIKSECVNVLRKLSRKRDVINLDVLDE